MKPLSNHPIFLFNHRLVAIIPTHRLHFNGIFTSIWVIFRANVGKYSSTMEHMGNDSGDKWKPPRWSNTAEVLPRPELPGLPNPLHVLDVRMIHSMFLGFHGKSLIV